jgi:hypothetical protein
VLWFLRALENEYTTRVDHPVRFINLPDQMISLSPLPQRISLEVKGLGFSVLRHNWNFSKTPLIIDFKKLKSVPRRKQTGFVENLPMNQYFIEFSSQLRDLRVMAILPDTLTLKFAYRKTREIRVLPVMSYESGLSPLPDSLVQVTPPAITVEGPDLVLDTMKYIRTVPIKINGQVTAFSRSIALSEVHKLVKGVPAKVTVTVRNSNHR